MRQSSHITLSNQSGFPVCQAIQSVRPDFQSVALITLVNRYSEPVKSISSVSGSPNQSVSQCVYLYLFCGLSNDAVGSSDYVGYLINKNT
jgi:hypothetical protein